MTDLTPDEARHIADEAFVYAYPMVHGYRALHWLGIRKGGFNRLDHYRHIIDPTDDLNMEVQINLDTLYTLVPVDLRAEPLVLTVPPIDRYYSIQFSDLYMHNYFWVGTRTTGSGSGNYLITGPDWSGDLPEGITDLIYTETWVTYFIIRTVVNGPEDEPAVNAIQDGFTLQPLSRFQGREEAPITDPGWPWPSREMLLGLPTYPYLNFLLTLAPPRDDEVELMQEFARIGIGPGLEFDIEQFPAEIQQAIEEGAHDALKRITAKKDDVSHRENGWWVVPRIRGNKELLSGSPEKRFTRAVQAMFGIYGTDQEECTYFPARFDADDQRIDGGKYDYRLHFPVPPPVEGFWSVTAYDTATEFLVPNDLGRYALGDRSDLIVDEDGGITLYLQHDPPPEELIPNWLPIPTIEVLIVLRMYYPDPSAYTEGGYVPPGIERVRAR